MTAANLLANVGVRPTLVVPAWLLPAEQETSCSLHAVCKPDHYRLVCDAIHRGMHLVRKAIQAQADQDAYLDALHSLRERERDYNALASQ